MEEKRRDAGTLSAASSAIGGSPAGISRPAEASPSEPTSSRRRAGGQKRKANNGNASGSSSTPSKRVAREKLLVQVSSIHNGPWTRARQTPNNLASTAAAGHVADGGLQSAMELAALHDASATEAAGEEAKRARADWQALESAVDAEFEAIRSRDANAHVVPVHCGWFSWTKVHPLEERTLPSFFNRKSDIRTPDIYLEIRNWIMKKFHANPNVQIELKDLSELSAGELDARQEVMEFLDYWGLINFHPFPSADSAASKPVDDGTKEIDSLVEKLYRFETVKSCLPIVPRTSVATPVVPSRLFPESTIAEELVRPEGPAVEYHCNSCSADCSRKRYHCQKQADFDLCTECFNNGKFDSDMAPSDFILMEPAEVPGLSSGKWTDQETLLLLEALELYKENWNEIAEHVATKTKAQCILHFVQMPIEDTFLDCNDETDANIKETVDPVSDNNDLSAVKDAPELTEIKTNASEDQPSASPMEISKPEDSGELNSGQETSEKEAGENSALKALKEAFEAVGSLPTPDGQFSFAEAGNPVMALAAFLVRLVEPDLATVSAHCSLKSLSGNSPGIQLSARHCFILEDPPDDKRELTGSERAVAETIDKAAQKDENQQVKKSIPVLDGSNISNDHAEQKIKDSIQEEKEPDGECISKSPAKEPDVMAMDEPDEAPDMVNDQPAIQEDHTPRTIKGMDGVTSTTEFPASPVKKSDGDSVKVSTQCENAPKDVDMVPDSLPSEDKEPQQPVTSDVKVDTKPLQQVTSDAMVEVEPEQQVTSDAMVDTTANSAEGETVGCNNEKHRCVETKNDHNTDKIKRAAITALSAAVVKAKLLANQEEDHIRQLASSLIEKQLHKLETKLAFFNEIESVIARVREQLDRSRQRLYHERAQIIAARFGMPASSSRAMQQPLPTNRIAANYANSMPKPPLSMTSPRPPIARPIMTPTFPASSPFLPNTVAGNSIRPSGQEKLSSVGMK